MNSRIPVYDYIRFIAVILAVAVHVIGADLAPSVDLVGTPLYENLNFIRWWCLNCNMIFIMLSGALLLPYKDETVGHFYGKRLTKVAIPLIVYYLFYYFFFTGIGQAEPTDFKGVIINILTANTRGVNANHFWVMYTTLALYIVFIFIRKMLKDYPYELLTKLVIAGIGISTVGTFVPLNVDLSWTYLGWIFVAITGFWITKEESRKYDNLLIAFGIVATVLMWVAYRFSAHINIPLSNLSPLRFLSVMGIFALCLKFKDKLREFYLIKLISKYSYGMMLVHFWVISFLLRRICTVSSVMYNGLGCIVSMVVTLVISFIAAFIIDNTIIAILYKIFYRKRG